MNKGDFRKRAHQMVDWMADYLEQVDNYTVMSQVKPGDIKAQLPNLPPTTAESFEQIMADVDKIIMPGITHWGSSNFFAYFPASKSEASILAEMMMASLGTQGMLWLTSPAATELEEQMMQWLRQMMGLPAYMQGVIQDTASSATLAAILSAREKASNWAINERGFSTQEKFVVYSSDQVHSSIDKAVKIAGIGIENLRRIPTDENFAMIPNALKAQIEKDKREGFQPLCVVSALGTTSSTALDPIDAIGSICEAYGIWHHVDAAYAGAALLLPECRYMAIGMEKADSFVFNPHKWMFVNFDCSVYFVKDAQTLKRTFSVNPEYLRTSNDDEVTNYRDWHIQLGRRFRALKLWFVIRSYGVEGLQEKLRSHIAMGQWLKTEIENHPQFELMAPVPLNLVCFRFLPPMCSSTDEINQFNEHLLNALNVTGKIFITHTKLNGMYTLRLVPGNFHVSLAHVQQAWELITKTAISLQKK
ncbi:pyridoxal phosphate-dependent decarboxylase family protein [Fulvivirgaceae bacterium LMO-SS25]